MTTEDLNQIRGVVREEISAAESRLREEFHAEIAAAVNTLRQEFHAEIAAAVNTLRQEFRAEIAAAVNTLREEFRAEIAAAEKSMIERLDRAVEALTINLSEVRTELSQRLDTLQKRNDHLSTAVFGIESQMAGVGRSLDSLLTESGAQTGTLLGYQKAFNALEARVRALEEKIGGEGPRPH